jgi:hypothetical protein
VADKGWKAAEREFARDIGGKRIPVTGERAGSDVTSSMFCFQVKVRRALPVWLFDWLTGIVKSARTQDKIGVLVIRRPREPRRNALVCVRWEDWVALHGDKEIGECVIDAEVEDES